MRIDDLVRNCMKDYRPYDSKQTDFKVKLDANESPFKLPLSVIESMNQYFLKGGELNLYPDDNAALLKRDIAEFWGADTENIVIGNGSDQIIDCISRMFIEPSDVVVCPTPSFGMYSASAVIMGGKANLVKLEKSENYEYRPGRIISEAKEKKAKIIYICTPNNPTGGIISLDDLRKIITECADSIVVVDEAYAEFSEVTIIPEILEYENAVVLRTFSKAYGLAGLRCGYSIANKALTKLISKAKPPYNTGSLSQLIARLVFKERNYIDDCISKIVDGREYLTARISCAGTRVFPSCANFVLSDLSTIPGIKKMHTERLGSKVSNALLEKGILVRSFEDPDLASCIRISAGTREQTDAMIYALEEIIDSLENSVL